MKNKCKEGRRYARDLLGKCLLGVKGRRSRSRCVWEGKEGGLAWSVDQYAGLSPVKGERDRTPTRSNLRA